VAFFYLIFKTKSGVNVAGYVYVSRERLKELEAELKELKTNGRKKMAERIAEARAHGDLSENAEYDAAKEEQGLLELRISKLEDVLSRVRVVDPNSFPNDEVHILANIRVKNLKNNKEYNYTMVSPEEADIKQGKIAITSPVGAALLGHKVGETVTVKAPAGLIQFKILSIE